MVNFLERFEFSKVSIYRYVNYQLNKYLLNRKKEYFIGEAGRTYFKIILDPQGAAKAACRNIGINWFVQELNINFCKNKICRFHNSNSKSSAVAPFVN
ncbi:hypothetical protein D1818_06315 [Aquimarina sp. BL5]|nr:hypothetical protein D1818_06315 [Aquimarina sp. BL5]RKM99844.1 hypothetical protein D7036_19590 [Aquimarina sp. BL5]